MEKPRPPGNEQLPCWCTQVDFSRDLLEKLPAEARGQACICLACARQRVCP
ncbi:MAG: cysteine-rich CWC family protein [Ramlibacter sp.]